MRTCTLFIRLSGPFENSMNLESQNFTIRLKRTIRQCRLITTEVAKQNFVCNKRLTNTNIITYSVKKFTTMTIYMDLKCQEGHKKANW